MTFELFRRRTIWFPTWLGGITIFGSLAGVVVLWWFGGESFLAKTDRESADVIVVEGWTVGGGVATACSEFKEGHYQRIVATGTLSGEKGDGHRWDYSEEAEEQILRLKIPRERVLRASAGDPEAQRTFAMAVAAYRTLKANGPMPKSINIVTRGAHARRSRLVFAKVFGPNTEVGVIAWRPPGFESEPWWHSSERAKDLIMESVGYAFELLLNSGRTSNSAEN